MRDTVGERVTKHRDQQAESADVSALRRLPGFAIVGIIGFLIDAGILTVLMVGYGVDHYTARAASFTVAVTVTWYLNRRWVFDRAAVPMRGSEYSAYLVVQVIGALINVVIFVLVIELVPGLKEIPVIPLAIGAAAGLLFNFTASSLLVFPTPANQKSRRSDFSQ